MHISDWLYEHYKIHPETKRWVAGKECYQAGQYVYFITSIENNEIIHMEQAVVAYYIAENSYNHMAIPIPNHQGEWLTPYQDKHCIVVQGTDVGPSHQATSGSMLAQFHQMGSQYSYEPKAISSYGQWKQLWIDKVSWMEQTLEKAAQKKATPYYRLVMDVLPYIIGLSENAIQYIGESDQELRFQESDQGTIAFRRYMDQLQQPVMWPMELVYDHPARDIAEFLRQAFLQQNPQAAVTHFLREYQTIRPVSVFFWRLVYARLLFPIHLYDCLERNLLAEQKDDGVEQLEELLRLQARYEANLSRFFEWAELDCDLLQIPVLHWL
ncbi:hypothetical protein [Virgibacillus pantothenticus]|uniref:hypothetical protein n=1 Tax=Virgibacillus pantothenticus TaxID=1473 RepID=UPI0009852165|nr:hypothetical protein [Virgibacillus pantothenticus]